MPFTLEYFSVLPKNRDIFLHTHRTSQLCQLDTFLSNLVHIPILPVDPLMFLTSPGWNPT